MNSLMTKVHGKRIMDCDLLFNDQKISFSGNAMAALINTLAMTLVCVSSGFNIINNDRELTNTWSIAAGIITILALVLATVSMIKYLKTRNQNLISFKTEDIQKVIVQEKPKSLKISFKLNNNTTHKISCAKDRFSGRLVQFLKDSNTEIIYS